MTTKTLISLPKEFPDKPVVRTPDQQAKIAKAIAFQDEIARKMQHVKTDSTEEIRRWRKPHQET